MAAIDLVVLLCSVLIFGLPTLASHMICLHGDEDSRLVGIAEKTQDWLQYLVSNTYRHVLSNFTKNHTQCLAELVQKFKFL